MLLNTGAHKVLIEDGNPAPKVKANVTRSLESVPELAGTSPLPDSLQCIASGGTVCMNGMLAEQLSFADFAPMQVIPATVALSMVWKVESCDKATFIKVRLASRHSVIAFFMLRLKRWQLR
jgi:hypothetical protein